MRLPRPTALAAAVQALAAALLAAPSAWAQDATQRIEITGSSIKRIDAETALPVQVITRQDIQKSGATTGSISSISLRGLTSLRTLVLLNGRRIAP